MHENLSMMHHFHLVHMDIKPDNIMFSPYYKRVVFIDFGLSRIISEPIGVKTLSNYIGTPHYWSPEMNKCFLSKKPKFIDLYYNDLYCLSVTIKDIVLAGEFNH